MKTWTASWGSDLICTVQKLWKLSDIFLIQIMPFKRCCYTRFKETENNWKARQACVASHQHCYLSNPLNSSPQRHIHSNITDSIKVSDDCSQNLHRQPGQQLDWRPVINCILEDQLPTWNKGTQWQHTVHLKLWKLPLPIWWKSLSQKAEMCELLDSLNRHLL